MSMFRFLVVLVALFSATAVAQEPVTVYNFARAETDRTIKYSYDQGGFGVLHHERTLKSIDEQPVIRQNRDTLYSTGVLDLSKPATVTLTLKVPTKSSGGSSDSWAGFVPVAEAAIVPVEPVSKASCNSAGLL